MIGDAIDIAQQQGTEASLKKLKTDIEKLRDSIPPFALKKIQHIFLLPKKSVAVHQPDDPAQRHTK